MKSIDTLVFVYEDFHGNFHQQDAIDLLKSGTLQDPDLNCTMAIIGYLERI